MNITLSWYWLSVPPALVAIVLINVAIYRFLKKVDQTITFIRELHDNHLPHIYARLGAIERGLGLPSPDPPKV